MNLGAIYLEAAAMLEKTRPFLPADEYEARSLELREIFARHLDRQLDEARADRLGAPERTSSPSAPTERPPLWSDDDPPTQRVPRKGPTR